MWIGLGGWHMSGLKEKHKDVCSLGWGVGGGRRRGGYSLEGCTRFTDAPQEKVIKTAAKGDSLEWMMVIVIVVVTVVVTEWLYYFFVCESACLLIK